MDNDSRIKQLVKNQRDYVDKFNKSFLGEFYKFKLYDNDVKDKECFETYAKYIKKINSINIRRVFQSSKQWLKLLLYLFKNKNVAKESKKIRKLDNVYLTVACIIKNESPYIKEWIDFHIQLGVDRFIIFDNDSEDNIATVLEPYIELGKVIYIKFPGNKVQVSAYNLACLLSRKNTNWLALIDADEFLFSPLNVKLPEILKNYEGCAAIGVNWVVYGHCGIEKKPDGLVRKNYVMTFSDKNNELNCRIKSIVNPRMVMAAMSAHHCWYKKRKFAVDENKQIITGDAIYAPYSSMLCTYNNNTNILRINHYWTKSKEELKAKCNRGYPDGHAKPQYESILKRLDYPMKKDDIILKIGKTD